jgi:hypothetical protein
MDRHESSLLPFTSCSGVFGVRYGSMNSRSAFPFPGKYMTNSRRFANKWWMYRNRGPVVHVPEVEVQKNVPGGLFPFLLDSNFSRGTETDPVARLTN